VPNALPIVEAGDQARALCRRNGARFVAQAESPDEGLEVTSTWRNNHRNCPAERRVEDQFEIVGMGETEDVISVGVRCLTAKGGPSVGRLGAHPLTHREPKLDESFPEGCPHTNLPGPFDGSLPGLDLWFVGHRQLEPPGTLAQPGLPIEAQEFLKSFIVHQGAPEKLPTPSCVR
jgi:hypothetical protein